MKKQLALAVAVVLTAGGVALLAQGTLRPPAKDPQKQGKPITAVEVDAKATDEKALLETLFAYKEAFNKGDVNALVALFSPKAELIDEDSTVIGPEAIRKEFTAVFERNPGAKLELAPDWYRWLSPEVILQHGTARVTYTDGSQTYTSYTAAHVKKDGKWLIAMVREVPAASTESGAQETNLQALSWMVGDWVDADSDSQVDISVAWSRNKTFLIRNYSVVTAKGVEMEGTEMIGWDQSKGIIRSWFFDSNGSFGEAVWLPRGGQWYARVASVLTDGKKASALHIYTPQSANRYVFRSVSRQVDGEMQPDIDPVVVQRAVTPQPE